MPAIKKVLPKKDTVSQLHKMWRTVCRQLHPFWLCLGGNAPDWMLFSCFEMFLNNRRTAVSFSQKRTMQLAFARLKWVPQLVRRQCNKRVCSHERKTVTCVLLIFTILFLVFICVISSLTHANSAFHHSCKVLWITRHQMHKRKCEFMRTPAVNNLLRRVCFCWCHTHKKASQMCKSRTPNKCNTKQQWVGKVSKIQEWGLSCVLLNYCKHKTELVCERTASERMRRVLSLGRPRWAGPGPVICSSALPEQLTP